MTDRRAKYREGLSSLYLPSYDALCEELPEEWQPYYGLRTFEEQALIWRQGRELPGPVVTNARPGQSAHNYGCASDWTIFHNGRPLWPPKADKRWQVYVDAVRRVGLKPGAEFGDFPHNELRILCSWSHVLLAFNQGGMRVAQEKIESSLEKGRVQADNPSLKA